MPVITDLSPPQLFTVAIEYVGATVPPGIGALRRPVMEHAYEVHTGLMPAHPRDAPRVAFPQPGRGWPTAPTVDRCPVCVFMILDLIRDLVGELVTTTRLQLGPGVAGFGDDSGCSRPLRGQR